jgi:hypothetical protein
VLGVSIERRWTRKFVWALGEIRVPGSGELEKLDEGRGPGDGVILRT